jgi:N-hydroxyarylamine O-acetyltransferase
MYELVKGPDSAWRLREHDGTGWTTIQTFTEEPQYFVDVDVANYNTATHPKSPFVQRAILVRKDETSVRRLLGREYTVLRPGQPTEQRQLTDQELAALLRAEFGGALSDSDVGALVRAADSPAGPPEADVGPR